MFRAVDNVNSYFEIKWQKYVISLSPTSVKVIFDRVGIQCLKSFGPHLPKFKILSNKACVLSLRHKILVPLAPPLQDCDILMHVYLKNYTFPLFNAKK